MRSTTARHFTNVHSLPEPEPDPTPPPSKVRVLVLASGSKGNCTLLAYGQHALLIDCGITPTEAAKRCRSVGYPLTQLDAILLTHWHKDHVHHLSAWTSFQCVVVCSKATHIGLEVQPPKHRKAQHGEILDTLCPDSPWEVIPLRVDHEEGSLAYHLRAGGKNIVFAHDLGQPNSTLLAAARAADCLLIETNHSVELLGQCQAVEHSAELHARILSAEHGHLSNTDASTVVSHTDPDRLQSIVGLHVSSHHNTEELAEEALRAGIPAGGRPAVYIARQDSAVLIEVNGGPSPLDLSLTEKFRVLDRKVDAVIAEQKHADSETAERRVVMGEYLAQMRELFEQKDPGTKLQGFEFFDSWKKSKAEAYGVSERSMNYYLLDAETVVPLIGREAAINLPLGTMAELGKLAKAKGSIPAATLQYAQEHPAHEVKQHVAAILYPGKTGHFDGPEDFLTITAGKDKVKYLRQLIDQARVWVDTEAPDHEVVEYALKGFIEYHEDQERIKMHAEAEDQHTEEITDIAIDASAPVPPAPEFDIDEFITTEETHVQPH